MKCEYNGCPSKELKVPKKRGSKGLDVIRLGLYSVAQKKKIAYALQ